MKNTFLGRPFSEWYDIYVLLKFQGKQPNSFKDLMNWYPPRSPQECVDLTFDLAEARAVGYDNPVPKWIENILINDRRPHRDLPEEHQSRDSE